MRELELFELSQITVDFILLQNNYYILYKLLYTNIMAEIATADSSYFWLESFYTRVGALL